MHLGIVKTKKMRKIGKISKRINTCFLLMKDYILYLIRWSMVFREKDRFKLGNINEWLGCKNVKKREVLQKIFFRKLQSWKNKEKIERKNEMNIFICYDEFERSIPKKIQKFFIERYFDFLRNGSQVLSNCFSTLGLHMSSFCWKEVWVFRLG